MDVVKCITNLVLIIWRKCEEKQTKYQFLFFKEEKWKRHWREGRNKLWGSLVFGYWGTESWNPKLKRNFPYLFHFFLQFNSSPMSSPLQRWSLDGFTALVTGGTRGIGSAPLKSISLIIPKLPYHFLMFLLFSFRLKLS